MKKQVEVQFQDDRYMDISKTQNKLIEGIKHQYHAMKLSTTNSMQSTRINAGNSMNL